jgi:hypothetical protein
MQSIEELGAKLKGGGVGRWEEVMFKWFCDFSQQLAVYLLEDMDEDLMREREPGLEVVGFREHRITTVFGDIRIKRRLFRDSNGKYRFLLDEAMGLDKGCHVSPRVKELATFIASHLPFQRSEEILGAVLPSGISHTSIHRLVGKVSASYLDAEEKEVKEVYEAGVIPESQGKVVPHLFVEADGTFIALQREKSRRAEVKIGVAHEGWQEVSTDRYRTKEKTVYSGIMDGDRFWEGFSLALAKKYDLSQVGEVVVGGDGAHWVKEGAELLGGIYQLDRFHLRRALNQVLDNGLVMEVYQTCTRGDVARAESILASEQQKSSPEQATEIGRLRGYLLDNAFGLRDYRLVVKGEGLRGLGAIESNVDKVACNRMKKRGMSWTIKGANNMARLISLREMGQLHSRITRKETAPQNIPVPEVKVSTKLRPKDDAAWLAADLPALHGPHQDRPWVHILRELSHGFPYYSGLSPTNS